MEKRLSKYNAALKADADKRAKEVAKLKNGGWDWLKIAAHFKISRQRAQQLYDRATALRNVS